ncbi:MAG TPA: alpha-L-fucosidase [Marinilabiliales bacterium]|nr:MAG: alpha-L-fucosidase [Bacteroidetes bacterium GWA2_40_14]OFX64703.1 MAG: alpha-L-fucosidase [Bacteroidetes bacterium GWC2_40_13]OFX73618.1 MAG: alpha-L-fucosidase [Bacteroidetes bacterium GWD2_40_43]OFX88494.1 MAG: alpha-L-fucosidase [Bacteroidetes bacterium GWE2_40_63]OFY22652.1 MAG: alpha-L-fucosidase [Bacteroidetes bacterium GWF2_40_13]OFZ25320.1 MAG: alpha-L-fucosidase [Bacteroidetes bacterium RIFOXYC2_FULL_40_12]HAN00189.1 alpha-L-fucosidase [Marinilabiliales bacterium]
MLKKTIIVLFVLCSAFTNAQEIPQVIVNTDKEPIQSGIFNPDWQSLSQYKVPEWFRNAKFGIWAHWGPQCQPEMGDWYGRFMYNEGSWQYNEHLKKYRHPSKFGFKDVINEWKAENWDAEKLVALYKKAGAQYFFAMANHHDNLDLWDSKYQEWNTLRVGPQKNIMDGWAKAAKKNNLPFGISVHATHAWTWFETSQRSDTAGEFVGVPYDGKLTKADGKGTWWEGLDPQELYAQNHPLSKNSDKDITALWGQWNWENGASIPSQAYCEKFYNRTIDLINKYNPDLVYFDDTSLPLYPISDAGLKIAAHYYNTNMATHNGQLNAVLFGKVLTDEQKKCMVWDVERGAPDKGQYLAWQTCTCIGDWHYNRGVYESNSYKSASVVIRMLVDIVSKNGNLLLNIPVRGDGTIDEKEVKILENIAAWMEINKESVFNTRPWKIFGEGPSVDAVNTLNGAGFNEGKVGFTEKDIRFNQNGNILYATVMGVPSEAIQIKSLAKYGAKAAKIELLGSTETLVWEQTNDNLVIQKPKNTPNNIALAFKITLK